LPGPPRRYGQLPPGLRDPEQAKGFHGRPGEERIVKITRIKPLIVAAPPHRNWVFVKVETDQPGLYGWGEATLEWKTRGVAGSIEDFAPIVEGRDPRNVTQIVEALTKAAFWPLGVIGLTAVSAIEQALWDIKGKDLGRPVWDLLGGQVRDRVRVYTHVGSMTKKLKARDDIASVCESVAEIREAGYTAMKFGPVPYTQYDAGIAEVKQVGAMLAAMRDTAGDDVDILLDFHGRPASISAALAYIEAVAPARPMFVEEPVQPGDPEAMRIVSSKTMVPIATGERLLTHREYEDLCNLKAVAYVQPDLCHCGGFTVGRQIAATAAANYMGVCPHNPMGPIAGAVGLHFGVAIPNFVILEEASGSVPWFHDVVHSPIRRIDGYWQVPTAPGLGVEIDEAEAARHPFQQEEIAGLEAVSARDGSAANW
jgi:galactonate dehydratase